MRFMDYQRMTVDLFMINFNDAFEDDAEVKIENPQTYDDAKKLKNTVLFLELQVILILRSG